MKRILIIACLIILLSVSFYAGLTARVYGDPSTTNAGIAWEWGGIETRGVPGLFICYQFQLAPLFPSLTVDC